MAEKAPADTAEKAPADTIEVVKEAPGKTYYPVRPGDIKSDMSAFGNHKIGEAAENLFSFYFLQGGWYSFTIKELYDHCFDSNFNPNLTFYGLIGYWTDDSSSKPIKARPYLVVDEKGLYLANRILYQSMRQGADRIRRLLTP